MKKLIIVFSIFFLIIGGVLFALTKTLDAENYKSQIIQATQELTGHTMEVSGPVDVQLFPSPTITLNDVKIKNIPGSAAPDLATIKKVIATVKWGSLFETPLIIETISLDSPEFFMERSEKGQVNWDFPFLQEKTINPEQDNLIGKSILEVPPQFKSLSVKNGSITYINALTGFKKSLNQIRGNLSADSINGPFKFSGSFIWNENPIQFTLSTGKLFAQQSSDIKLSLVDSNSKAQMNLTGKIENLTKTADTTGGFSVDIPKMSPFLETLVGYTNLPDTLEKPLIGTATFSFSNEKASFNDMAFRYGTSELENSISGEISFIYPKTKGAKTQINSSLVLSKIDLDSFMPILPKKDNFKSKFMSLNRNITSDLNLKLKATSVTYRNANLTGTTLNLYFHNGTTTLNEFKTSLPGNTILNIKGDIDIIENAPQAKLEVSLDSQDMKKTTQWLNMTLPQLFTFNNVEGIKASGNLTLRETDITLSNIDAEANDGKLSGNMTVSLTEKIPTAALDLSLKNINLDSYLNIPLSKDKISLSSLWKKIEENLQENTFLNKVNLTFGLNGTDITFRNIPVNKLSSKGQIQNGMLTLQDLKLEGAATANLALSGKVQKQNNQLIFTDVIYDFNVPRASIFLDRALISAPIDGQLNNVSISGTFSGQPDSFAFNTVLGMSQAQIKAQGQIQKKNGIPNYAVNLSIAHPNFHQFMKLFDENFDHFPYLTGTFIFQTTLNGTPNSFSLSGIDGMIGTQRFKGDATITNDMTRKIQANLTSPLFDLEKIYPKKDIIRGINPDTGRAQFSNDLLNFGDFEGLDLDITASADKMTFDTTDIDLMSTHFTLKEKVLNLEYLKGTLNEGKISIEGSLNTSTAEPIIDAIIQGENIKVAQDNWALGRYRLKNGMATFLCDFNARGNSLEDMVRSLSANGTYSVKEGTLSGIDLTEIENQTKLILHKGQQADNFETTLNNLLARGETEFTSLNGTYSISNGTLRTSDSMLRSPESNAIIQATIDLPNWTILSSIALSMTGFDGFPPISIVIKGLLHSPEIETDISGYVRYLTSASAQIRDIALQEKLERERQQAQMDADQRKEEASRLAGMANAKINETNQIIKIAPTPQGEEEFIRAQDAAAIINELSLKESISVTDLKKIEEQYNLLLQRINIVQKASLDIALSSMQQQAQNMMSSAQATMNAINRIYQRLIGVEIVDSAYKKGFEMFTLMGRLRTFINQSQDLSKTTQALTQMKQAQEILTETYNSISKFDVDAPTSESNSNTSSRVRGKIIRNNSL